MAQSRWDSPPKIETQKDFDEYVLNLHHLLFGVDNAGGVVNNSTTIADTSDVSDTATQLNALLAELRTQGIIGA
jgi:hypothetical protein